MHGVAFLPHNGGPALGKGGRPGAGDGPAGSERRRTAMDLLFLSFLGPWHHTFPSEHARERAGSCLRTSMSHSCNPPINFHNVHSRRSPDIRECSRTSPRMRGSSRTSAASSRVSVASSRINFASSRGSFGPSRMSPDDSRMSKTASRIDFAYSRVDL